MAGSTISRPEELDFLGARARVLASGEPLGLVDMVAVPAGHDVEALVLNVVDVQRRHLAGGHRDHVDEAERLPARENACARSQEVELLGA